MNIHQLECFVSLASTLNFAKTAEQLGLTQPAVSKQIRAMETELDASLFERSTRSVSLTPIGRRFLSEANDMLQIFYRAKQWIGSYDQAEKNVIRIGYSDPHAIQFISHALKRTRASFSENITPQLVLDQTDANLGRLQKDQIDFVIGMRDAKFDDHTITFTKINENRFKFIISKEHPFTEKMIKKALSENSHTDNRNFEDEEHIIHTQSFQHIRQILAIPPYLLKHFFSRGHYLLPVNDNLDNIICANVNEAYGMVLACLGYALVPEYLIIDHPDILFFDWAESPQADFGIYHKKNSNKHSAFSHFLKNVRYTPI